MELVIFFTELSLSLPISTYISTFSRKSLIAAVYSLKEYHVTPVLSSQKGIRGKNINSKIEHLRAVLACVNSILWDLICFQTFPSVILTALPLLLWCLHQPGHFSGSRSLQDKSRTCFRDLDDFARSSCVSPLLLQFLGFLQSDDGDDSKNVGRDLASPGPSCRKFPTNLWMKETESINYKGSILTRAGQDRRAEILCIRLGKLVHCKARQRYTTLIPT